MTASPIVSKGRAKPPALKTRKLTGLPTWPIALIASIEGGGKSYSAIEASLSPMIGHTFGMEIGETSLDPYGALVDPEHFDLLEHDGTYADIAAQLWAAVEQPRVDPDKPNLLILDGASGLWDLLVNELQIIANDRAKRGNKRVGEDGQADVTPDLWNAAKKRWHAVVDLLKSHDGPVIITGRLNEVAVFEGAAPKRNGEKEWKVEAHKSLPFDVDLVLQARAVRDWEATKARSLKLQIEPGRTRKLPEFTFDKVWRLMGIDENTKTARRQFTAQNAEAGAQQQQAEQSGAIPLDQWVATIAACEVPQQVFALHGRARLANQLDEVVDGQTIEARLKSARDRLVSAEAADQAAVNQAAAERPPSRTAEVVAAAQGRRLPEPDAAAEQTPEKSPEQLAEEAAAQAEAEGEQRGMLVDELLMIARIKGADVKQLTHRHLPNGPRDVPVAKLQEVTAGLRIVAITALKQQKRTAEAEHYAKIPADAFGPESFLLGEVTPATGDTGAGGDAGEQG